MFKVIPRDFRGRSVNRKVEISTRKIGHARLFHNVGLNQVSKLASKCFNITSDVFHCVWSLWTRKCTSGPSKIPLTMENKLNLSWFRLRKMLCTLNSKYTWDKWFLKTTLWKSVPLPLSNFWLYSHKIHPINISEIPSLCICFLQHLTATVKYTRWEYIYTFLLCKK